MNLSNKIASIQAYYADLTFVEDQHIYIRNNRILPSVSSLVESHAPKFNTTKMAPLSARKEGISVEEIKAKWDAERIRACDLGHTTHSFLEHYNGTQLPETPFEEAGIEFIKDFSTDYYILFREIRMYSLAYDYAGTEDLILLHKRTGDIIAADYKTNKDLHKNYKGQCLYEPFQYTLCTPLSKYMIQLSYYQIMFEEIGEIVKDRILVHLLPTGNYEIHKLDDVTKILRQELTKSKLKLQWT